MERKRLLELALQGLEQQKAGIEEEIEALTAELKSIGTAVQDTKSFPLPIIKKRRKRTAAERKAQAQRMREIWAAKRAKSIDK